LFFYTVETGFFQHVSTAAANCRNR
jgi:hypothetical protein